MRHGKKIHKLERPSEHRRALISNLVSALITHKRIKTTESKAKALKPVMDSLITTAKKDTVDARRLAAKTVKQKETLKTLFDEIAPGMLNRTSGYSRIMRVGTRSGDGAEIVVIELIMDQQVAEEKTGKKSKKKLFGRKSAPKTEKVPAAESAEVAEETVEARPEADATQDDATEIDESEKPDK
jgi:large subunit ribosomal protein L17